MHDIEQHIVRSIVRTNWILFLAASGLGIAAFRAEVAGGIVLGGLIATLNFHLLHRSLRRSFGEAGKTTFQAAISKYYARFLAEAILLFLLISQRLVDPLGLIVGLSVVVVSIMLTMVLEFSTLMRFLTGDPSEGEPADRREEIIGLAYYAGLVFSVVLPLVLALTLGIYLDKSVFGSFPWITLVLVGISVLAGFRSISAMIRKIRKY